LIAFNRIPKQKKDLQIAEFYGNMENNHEYMSETYKNFLFTLKDIDYKYKNTKNLEDKVNLSKQQIKTWHEFIKTEEKTLPEEEGQIKEKVLINLKDIWLRYKVK
jgi:hypothetical protein